MKIEELYHCENSSDDEENTPLSAKGRSLRKRFQASSKTDMKYKKLNKPRKNSEEADSFLAGILSQIASRDFVLTFASIGEIFMGIALPFEVSTAPELGALYKHLSLHMLTGCCCATMGVFGLLCLKCRARGNIAMLLGFLLILTAMLMIVCALVSLTIFTDYDLSVPHAQLQLQLGASYSPKLYEMTMQKDHGVVNTIAPMLVVAIVLLATSVAMTCPGTCCHGSLYSKSVYQLMEAMTGEDAFQGQKYYRSM